MSILTYFGRLSDPSGPASIIARIMSDQYAADISAALKYVEEWQPGSEFNSYRQEMITRSDYLAASMQRDMRAEIKRRFPQSYKDKEREQLNIRLYQRLVRNRAKVFCSSETRFYLTDRDGKEVEGPDADAFNKMLERGGFKSMFKDMDLWTQGLQRSCVKLWWDDERKAIRPSVWPPHLVHVLINENKYWSVDSARAVLFELPVAYGAGDSRYEVNAIDEDGNSKLYITSLHAPRSPREKPSWSEVGINENNEIPYRDPETGRAIYPFVWVRADSLDAIYHIGPHDALTVNRVVNSTLTDALNAIHFQAWPADVYEHEEGSGADAVPAQFNLGPGFVGDLPPGVKLNRISSELDVGPVVEFCNTLLKLDALMDGQSPQAVQVDATSPESGYKLKIQNKPLEEHREDMIEVYRQPVEDILKRSIVVYNAHAQFAGLPMISTELVPAWKPGRLDVPVDDEAEARTWALRYASNEATPADRLMAEEGITRDEAIAKIEANAELNKKLNGFKFNLADRPGFDNENKDEDEQDGDDAMLEEEKPEETEEVDSE